MIVPRRAIERQAVARHYDELDPFYRALWGEHVHHGLWPTGRESVEEAVRLLVRQVAERAALEPGRRVCDVGSGYGAAARLLAQEYGVRVVACTISPVQHAHAIRASAGDARVEPVLGDWLEQRAEPAAYDAVIAIESTEHMAEKARFFERAAQALRPGGRLVVCAWLAADRVRGWERRRLLEPICAEGRLPSMGTAAEYGAWIRGAGLELVSADDLTRQVRRTWAIITRRMLRQLLTATAWRYLLDGNNTDRAFAITTMRIRAAYRTGCMRYAMLTASRP